MTILIEAILPTIFVFSVIFIWLMILYQFILSLGGFLLKLKMDKGDFDDREHIALPGLTILIPARNEEVVIRKTLMAMVEMDYPQDKVEIIVIDDGSTDRTAEIIDSMAQKYRQIKRINIPQELSGQGKAAALNLGVERAAHDILAVFDADNIPNKDSLKKLTRALITDKRLAAVTGKYQAYNKNKNILTRFINIESIAFQWLIQAGRWYWLKIAMLPGTNFVIKKSVLKELGGWNVAALTEDTELTFRIYGRGYLIKFLPTATSQEQEPERLSTWIRQRTRWARGNNYIIATFRKKIFKNSKKFMAIELLNLFYLYYLFIFAILFSDIIFILSLFKIVHIALIGPFTELWILAFLLFMLEILIALHLEGQDSPMNILFTFVAYITYTKLWIWVVLRSLFHDYILRKKRTWDKTDRFQIR